MWLFGKKPEAPSVVGGGTLSSVIDAVVTKPLEPPTAEPEEPELEASELDEYMKLATALGLEEQGAVMNERMRRFFVEENIHVFDNDQVAKYLNQELGPSGWVWAGLRVADVERMSGWTTHMAGGDVPFGERQYRGKVPMPVLLTVKKVSERFPTLHFYVSESKEVDGDPFLMVCDRDTSSFIVERWDEPSFREK